jgi:hypothetical protein
MKIGNLPQSKQLADQLANRLTEAATILSVAEQSDLNSTKAKFERKLFRCRESKGWVGSK